MKTETRLKKCVEPLLLWYAGNRRVLPWREDPVPYHVWLSEIMLQQTRVEAAKGYYERFLASLPDIPSLAAVPEDELLKLWEGLGYYNRARNLKKAAGVILAQYGGEMPASYEELLALPGIGEYTAGAIASIAFKLPCAAVDGNVLRVCARLLADDTDISDPALKKTRKAELENIMPADRPASFNQALMDLGAMICVPNGAPRCGDCPLSSHCLAKRLKCQDSLPVKKAQKARKIQDRTVFVIRYRDRVLLHKRPPKGLLAGLYELPSAEGHLARPEALSHVRILGFVPLHIEELPESRHVFSHLEWRMKAYLVRADELCSPDAPGEDYLLKTPQAVSGECSIPSAFSAYAPYIKADVTKQ
ncbi:MAG: A/G-specific adenine glycosylase [Lachnospiraceae bacterium]|nr:A/G-specific adenine glycosylase [Lachnospiraceae bacterium]